MHSEASERDMWQLVTKMTINGTAAGIVFSSCLNYLCNIRAHDIEKRSNTEMNENAFLLWQTVNADATIPVVETYDKNNRIS